VRHRGSERDALRDVSLELVRGEVLALVGPNGSGKSTALAALARSLPPRAGSVQLDDRDVWRWSRRGFARRVARLAQSPACPPGLRVEELVESGRHARRAWLAPPTPADRAAVREALRLLDLLDLRRREVERLSGGERRRAWIALVLCQQAEVLLLDEPTAALDLRHQQEVLALLARLNREHERTIAVVLHDLEQAAALAHRVAVMHRGRLYEVGPPERVIREEMLRDVYGVDARITKEDGHMRLRVLGPADPVRNL
jgi:iron complex transport system ATP-binding protein